VRNRTPFAAALLHKSLLDFLHHEVLLVSTPKLKEFPMLLNTTFLKPMVRERLRIRNQVSNRSAAFFAFLRGRQTPMGVITMIQSQQNASDFTGTAHIDHLVNTRAAVRERGFLQEEAIYRVCPFLSCLRGTLLDTFLSGSLFTTDSKKGLSLEFQPQIRCLSLIGTRLL
jgi:hypothetical protein